LRQMVKVAATLMWNCLLIYLRYTNRRLTNLRLHC
jgi:hypothetical protein